GHQKSGLTHWPYSRQRRDTNPRCSGRRSNARTAVPRESNPAGRRPPAAKRRPRRETFTRPDVGRFATEQSQCQTKVRNGERCGWEARDRETLPSRTLKWQRERPAKNSPAHNGIAQQEFRSIAKRCEFAWPYRDDARGWYC